MTKKDPYRCPRCNYVTEDKSRMRKHLYNNIKVCPATHNQIELTHEIKEYVLVNRVYHIKQDVPINNTNNTNNINNTINHYNTVMNFVSGIDTMRKLKNYCDYKQITLTPFDQAVQSKYEDTVVKLEKNQGHHEIRQDELWEAIDQVTKIKDGCIEDMNIIFDTELQKIRLYESGDWKELLLRSGLRTIVRTIQECLWNAYERYLIRKIENKKLPLSERENCRELLSEYYTFLACLDIDPVVKGSNNNQILFNPDDDKYWEPVDPSNIEMHTMVDMYTKMYANANNELTKGEKTRMMNNLVDLVKRNSKRNVRDLNYMVSAIINVDDEFKRTMLPTYSLEA